MQEETSKNTTLQKKATNLYLKLPKPKTCNLGTYLKIFIQTTTAKNKAKKSITPVRLDDPPKEFEAQAEFIKHFPPEALVELRNRIYDAPVKNRARVWRDLDVPVETLEQKFKKVVKSRINFAKSRGYKKYVDMFLDKYEISEKDYAYFVKNTDDTINYCNQELPKDKNLPDWFYSNFNLPCFICRQKDFPFKNNEEVIDCFAKKYPLMEKFKHKLEIKIGETSKMAYQVREDNFLITLAKRGNTRHRAMDLVHELSHVVWYLEVLAKNQNPYQTGLYQRELHATRIEFENLNNISGKLLQAQMAEVLLTLREAIFEIEFYKKPDQDLSKLYAKTFNKCFSGAKQKINPTYLINENIVTNAFSALPHAVAAVNVLSTHLAIKEPLPSR